MTNPETAPANSGPGRPQGCRSRGRGPIVVILALSAIGAGFFAGKAMSHGFGHHHFGHGPGFTKVFAPANLEDATDRAARMARHLAVEIDATKEQEAKLIALSKGVASDVFPIRQKIVDARKKGVELLKAPTIDRAAIEQLRAEQLNNIDAISKRLSTALADAGEVLTPEQRSKLAERIESGREHRGWWRHGPRE